MIILHQHSGEFEYIIKQADSIDEAIKLAGSKEEALRLLNRGLMIEQQLNQRKDLE